MINTLGDLITAAIIIAALLVVPYKIVKAWVWPIVKHSMMSGGAIMSRSQEMAPQKTDIEAVSIPVPDTSTNDGIDWQMPRVSAYLTDNEFTVFLARQKLRDGKYRLSANKIFEFVGGNRNEVLEIVRQVRAAPDFSNRTSDQEQRRKELELA